MAQSQEPMRIKIRKPISDLTKKTKRLTDGRNESPIYPSVPKCPPSPPLFPEDLQPAKMPAKEQLTMWNMPVPGRRKKRWKIKDKGPSHLQRYSGRCAPIPDSFVTGTTCRSGRPPYPSHLFEFFLEFKTFGGSSLCPFGKNMVLNGVFLRGLRVMVGGPSCFAQAQCQKKKNVCDGMMEGIDDEGNWYADPETMWTYQTGDEKRRNFWYLNGLSFWGGVDPTINGVLCGYGNLSGRDLVDSHKFLFDCLKYLVPDYRQRHTVALDCGAGIGRVTKNLLVHYADEVDLVEPVEHLLDAARDELHYDFVGTKLRSVNFYHNALQDFVPPPGRYDLIWIQWCIGHLTDPDAAEFLLRAKSGLKPGGFIVLKENIAVSGFVLDRVDSCVTRSDAYFRDLFQQAGLYVYKHRRQTAFPREFFGVQMYCLTTGFVKKPPKNKRNKDGTWRKAKNRAVTK